MSGDSQADRPLRVDPEKLRAFQEQVAQHASATPTPTPMTPGPTSGRLTRIGATTAFKRALENAERESKRRLSSAESQAAEAERLDQLAELETERRQTWLTSIDAACGLPPKLHGISWAELDARDTPQVAEAMQWAASGERSPWLYLSGPIGRGKTVLASLALRDLVATQGQWDNYRHPAERYGLFVKSRQMIAALRPYGEGIERYQTVPFLVIDDIGAENVGSPWVYEQLLAVIDERYDNRLDTILTSNLSVFGEGDACPLTNAMGDGGRIADRIIELATCIDFPPDAPNWRRV